MKDGDLQKGQYYGYIVHKGPLKKGECLTNSEGRHGTTDPACAVQVPLMG